MHPLDHFGVEIDLTHAIVSTEWKFSLVSERQERFTLTFTDPIGANIQMYIFSRQASGKGISGVVTERISTERMEGVITSNAIKAVSGIVTLSDIRGDTYILRIMLNAYD